jgi:hypothetical protein
MSYDDPVCNKCGEVMPQGEFDHWFFGNCKFEHCQEMACRALRNPVTLVEHQAALLHWKHHVPVRQEGK